MKRPAKHLLIVALLIGSLLGGRAFGQDKPGGKPAFAGFVVALSADGRMLTLESPPPKKGGEPERRQFVLTPRSRLEYPSLPADGHKPTVGYFAAVWVEDETETIARVRFEQKKGSKPGTDKFTLTARPPRPLRDPAPLSAAIDAAIDRRLAELKIPASPLADDAEFLRRVTLDLTGRIPTYRRTVIFLESNDPNKRSDLINELLASPLFGQHLATSWRNLLAPPEQGVSKSKGGRDTFGPWLAEQFNRRRGWDEIVRDLLTIEGPLKDNPQSAFLLANADNFQPQPNRVTASVASLFWGLSLRCAECHDHPFTSWRQTDFWATAAFFDRLRFTGFKGPGVPSLVDTATDKDRAGEGIVIPASAGKAAGKVIPARFLGAESRPVAGAPRTTFATWATSADNPFFSRAMANRMWAHFFGQGLIRSLDDLESGEPSHPALLRELARELGASGFDLEHLARAICNSKAYQRSSRPVAGNETAADTFCRMALKPLSPEAFYDALTVALSVDKNDPRPNNRGKGVPNDENAWPTREDFAHSFRTQGESGGASAPGLPQVLRLLNGPLLNRGAPIVDRLAVARSSPDIALTELYLTVLSRRPSAEEVGLLSAYLERQKNAQTGYRGVLWMLLNSGEFALNH
jgi:hypothetical protein